MRSFLIKTFIFSVVSTNIVGAEKNNTFITNNSSQMIEVRGIVLPPDSFSIFFNHVIPINFSVQLVPGKRKNLVSQDQLVSFKVGNLITITDLLITRGDKLKITQKKINEIIVNDVHIELKEDAYK